MKAQLTPQEEQVYAELIRLAGPAKKVSSLQLRDAGFAQFVASVYGANVGYPDAHQSRKLQLIRNKKWITMDRGTYSIL